MPSSFESVNNHSLTLRQVYSVRSIKFWTRTQTLMIKRSSILSLLFEHAVSSVSSFIQKGNALFAADIYDLLKNILSFKNDFKTIIEKFNTKFLCNC